MAARAALNPAETAHPYPFPLVSMLGFDLDHNDYCSICSSAEEFAQVTLFTLLQFLNFHNIPSLTRNKTDFIFGTSFFISTCLF